MLCAVEQVLVPESGLHRSDALKGQKWILKRRKKELEDKRWKRPVENGWKDWKIHGGRGKSHWLIKQFVYMWGEETGMCKAGHHCLPTRDGPFCVSTCMDLEFLLAMCLVLISPIGLLNFYQKQNVWLILFSHFCMTHLPQELYNHHGGAH